MLFTNVWYVAEFSDNVRQKPTGVRMLGRDFVLFRDPEGRAHCLSAVCPHRGARLSRGRCHDDGTVSCPFHGWHFDGSGQCTRVPSQADPAGDIPPAARVDSYPVEERYGLVWVFLGDDLASATPIYPMPEFDNPDWRRVRYADTWACNVHWSKMTDLDHVHLPIVHGINFGGDNPVRPPDHQVEQTDYGFRTEIISTPSVTKGKWKEMRSERTKVVSKLAFMVPGFTLRGEVDIGGMGSGFKNVFYEISTPIDEENTLMRWFFFRSFMLEPENDQEHLKRNLRNIFQDKANGESILPRRAPDVDDWPVVQADREDRVMTAYWQTLRDLRSKGWQIDRIALEALERDGQYRVIPSPGRARKASDWVFDGVPRLAANATAATRAKRGVA
jgi:phenylpropionate dioxygenase-like ring-hydroxylating dioxygenase large terminal subunit